MGCFYAFLTTLIALIASLVGWLLWSVRGIPWLFWPLVIIVSLVVVIALTMLATAIDLDNRERKVNSNQPTSFICKRCGQTVYFSKSLPRDDGRLYANHRCVRRLP